MAAHGMGGAARRAVCSDLHGLADNQMYVVPLDYGSAGVEAICMTGHRVHIVLTLCSHRVSHHDHIVLTWCSHICSHHIHITFTSRSHHVHIVHTSCSHLRL